MKNIHVLPTDKPSKLFIDIDDNKLKITEPLGGEYMMNQHIYITNDEEIKEGDYVYHNSGYVSIVLGFNLAAIKLTDAQRWSKDCKKIILTADQDLIKNGVQDIVSHFLEWFIKNPSCEFVKTKYIKTPDAVFRDRDVPYGYYQIIIPKEEQKQALIDMMKSDEESGLYDQEIKLEDIFNDEKRQGVKDLIDTHKQYFYCSDRLELDENERCVTQCDHCAGKHKQRPEKYSERFHNDKSEIGNPETWGKRIIEEPKQETLEEAAERILWDNTGMLIENHPTITQSMIDLAKWQQERSYSEEDLFKILLDFVAFPHDHMEPRGSIIERYLKELKTK